MAENVTENLVIKKSKMGCKKLLYLGNPINTHDTQKDVPKGLCLCMKA